MLGASVAVVAVLVSVGQPIFSDDTWWHLALGRAYWAEGPWLVSDPLLFTSAAAPPPASWLADGMLAGVWEAFGFTGLRVLHVGWVLAIGVAAFRILHSASRSVVAAGVGTSLIAVVSAYRLVQLRPHLGTILGAFLLFIVLVEPGRRLSGLRMATGALLIGLWAQIHPGYPLAAILLLAASAALLVFSWIEGVGESSKALAIGHRFRALQLGGVALAGMVASGIHPMGFDGVRKALAVGGGGESLAVVVDEWSRFEPFRWPIASLPPTPLVWGFIWALVLVLPAFGLLCIWRRRRAAVDRAASERAPRGPVPAEGGDRVAAQSWIAWDPIDPALLGISAASLLAILLASRFIWLGLFPVALVLSGLASAGPGSLGRPRAMGLVWLGAAVGLMLAPAYLLLGDWPSTTRGMPRDLKGYAMPYAAKKYHAAAVWFLRDSKLEGNLFGRYEEGGFQSFWLAPKVRTAMNGTLNMMPDALSASFAIRERIGTPTHPRFEAALDALGVDLFLGTGLPMPTRPGRPPTYSTSHLEASEGWLLVFRNLDASIRLRQNERNALNLERVAAYYAQNGISFDRATGFDPRTAIRENPAWAREQGLLTAVGPGEAGRKAAHAERAFLALGLYEEALAQNAERLKARPGDPKALARRAWLLMRPTRPFYEGQLRRITRPLTAIERELGPIERPILELAERVLNRKSVRKNEILMLPAFSRAEARALLQTIEPPPIR